MKFRLFRSTLSRDEIVRGFFHRENRILLRKSEIFALDTILYSPYNIKKSFKKPDLLGLWKNPLTIPYLVSYGYTCFAALHCIEAVDLSVCQAGDR